MGTNYYLIPKHSQTRIVARYFSQESKDNDDDDWHNDNEVIHIGKSTYRADGPLFIWSIFPDTLEESIKDYVIWSEYHSKHDDEDIELSLFQKHVLQKCKYELKYAGKGVYFS
jgi:hypothetical protein